MSTTKHDYPQTIQSLLKERYHGRDNINGIYYQIFYSIFRSFSLYEDLNVATIQFEGIEDIDLNLRTDIRVISVKTSQNSWYLSDLKKPLKSFSESVKAGYEGSYEIAVNFPLHHDIQQLNEKSPLVQNTPKRKFWKMCRAIGFSESETFQLFERLTITTLSNEHLQERVEYLTIKYFNIEAIEIPIYIPALFRQFTEWAKNRTIISKLDLELLRDSIQQTIADLLGSMADYQGYITSIEWKPDASPLDFYEGKSTRPSHIVSEVDYPRKNWLKAIETSFSKYPTCIIRSSSGQGKSALLYRYAFINREHTECYTLTSCRSQSEVEKVKSFLRKKQSIGANILVLIDNADSRTQFWPLISQECGALGYKVLVSTREEDWFRFATEEFFSYSTIEPTLELKEAREIFRLFSSQRKVHPRVISAEWAYERIGEMHLFIEYIYLLTHGRMIEERLKQQIKSFDTLGEDHKAKCQILRFVSIAHTYGISLEISTIEGHIDSRIDISTLLASLEREYLVFDEGKLTGLHPVRSQHIVDILHQGYPTVFQTITKLLPSITTDDLTTFVTNVLFDKQINSNDFLKLLSTIIDHNDIHKLLAVLIGVFAAGEQLYIDANISTFNKALEIRGFSTALLLGMEICPADNLNPIAKIKSWGTHPTSYTDKLQELANNFDESYRGVDYCKLYLNLISLDLEAILNGDAFSEMGELFMWFTFCDVKISESDIKKLIDLTVSRVFEHPINYFAPFCQGFYYANPKAYLEWYEVNKISIMDYLQFNCECYSLTITEEEVSFTFFADPSMQLSIYEQKSWRFDLLYASLPFSKLYSSKAIWSLFLLPIYPDESICHVENKNVGITFYQSRNATWMRVLQKRFLSQSWYETFEVWNKYRTRSLDFLTELSTLLKRNITGKLRGLAHKFSGNFPELYKLSDQLNFPTNSLSEAKKQSIKDIEYWEGLFSRFFRDIAMTIGSNDAVIPDALIWQIRSLVDHLPKMHNGFSELFKDLIDYFEMSRINKRETEVVNNLEMLICLYNTRKHILLQNIANEYCVIADNEAQQWISDFRKFALSEAVERFKIVVSDRLFYKYPSRYVIMSFASTNPLNEWAEAIHIIKSLPSNLDHDFSIYLVPLYDNKRFCVGGHRFSGNTTYQLKDDTFENIGAIIPSELDASIFVDYVKQPFQEIPALEVYGAISRIAHALKNFSIHQASLEAFTTDSEFQQQLHGKFISQFQNSVSGMRKAVEETISYTKQHLKSEDDNPQYEHVNRLLTVLLKNCSIESISSIDWNSLGSDAELQNVLTHFIN